MLSCTRHHAGKEPFNPAQMFSTAHADAINTLQHLSKALTRLQMAAQMAAITAALQVRLNAMLSPGVAMAAIIWLTSAGFNSNADHADGST